MALALDIDGTLTTANDDAVRRLVNRANRRGFQTHINTARSMEYCHQPDSVSLDVSSRDHHHCLVHPDPPTSKVLNMHRIQNMSGASKQCTILIDDRPENIDAVRASGFSGILVDEQSGITHGVADNAIRMIDECSNSNSAPSSGGHSRSKMLRLALLVVIILLVFMVVCRV